MSREYDVVDCHVHLYRTTREGWQGRAIEDRVDAGGTVEQLLRYMGEAGIKGAWIINAWPTLNMTQTIEGRFPAAEREQAREGIREVVRGRCERKNEWICRVAREHPGQFAAFIGIDPYFGSQWMVQEIETRFHQGAKGVKIISTWGGFYPSDSAMWPAYEKMQELGMTLLAHSGGVDVLTAVVKERDYAFPVKFDRMLADFPRLNVVLAHLGYGWSLVNYGPEINEQRVRLAKRYPNVYFDLSFANEEGFSKPQEDLIREVGVDRVLWASDWHTHRAILCLEGLKQAGFSEDEKRKMLGENARRLVKI